PGVARDELFAQRPHDRNPREEEGGGVMSARDAPVKVRPTEAGDRSYDAHQTDERREAERKKEATRNLVHESLAPLREAYLGMTSPRRRALLAYVIGYLTR